MVVWETPFEALVIRDVVMLEWMGSAELLSKTKRQ